MNKIAISSIVCLAAASSAFANISYNVASGFPTATSLNPNGNWSYAYSAPGSLTSYTLYNATQFSVTGSTSEYSTANVQYNVPLIAHTTGDNYLFMHPGPNDEKVIVIFTASLTGQYNISGQWVGTDPSTNGNGTDVHVIQGANSLYSGTSTFNSAAAFNVQNVFLTNGQTLEFAMGDNGVYYNDSTNFQATITATPEPSFYGFLGAGIAGLGFFVRRRRA